MLKQLEVCIALKSFLQLVKRVEAPIFVMLCFKNVSKGNYFYFHQKAFQIINVYLDLPNPKSKALRYIWINLKEEQISGVKICFQPAKLHPLNNFKDSFTGNKQTAVAQMFKEIR